MSTDAAGGRVEQLFRRLADSDVVASLLSPVAVIGAATHELLYNHYGWLAWLGVLGLVAPLVFRRRAPVVTFLVSLFLAVVLWVARVDTVAYFALLVELYTIANQRSLRVSLLATGTLEACLVLLAFRFAPVQSINDALIVLSAMAGVSLFLGTTVQEKRRSFASVQDRALRLEREQEHQSQLAAAEERNRIAREMHDIIAHGVAVMVALAQGAAVKADSDPVAAQESMQQVAVTGRQSLAEMRKILGLLRNGDAPALAPEPNLAALQTLLDEARRTELCVDYRVTGDTIAVPAIAQASVYRIVQEAVTNVLKHAYQATAVTIRVNVSDVDVVFSVCDNGSHVRPGVANGNGIRGMRERVSMFKGQLAAGPTPAGWEVRGRLAWG